MCTWWNWKLFFFNSVVKGILQSNNWHAVLSSIGITDYNVATISNKLRNIFVHEITNEKLHYYQSFTTLENEEFLQEAFTFVNDGYFNSCLGDLVPLAISNALKASFVIFRPSKYPLYVTPEDNTSLGTMFLVYQCDGLGHYDAAIPMVVHDPSVTTSTPDTSTKCSCGINSKDSTSKACVPKSLTMYPNTM